ncbi:MAG TPA: chemotaxis protein CheA [Deferrisomatales bacterium]|nr:chemotaxis protein CheA [Deferrisomatales bacterium]
MERYRKLFLEEGRKHLQGVETCLLERDEIGRAEVDELFREIHSLKGMAASMGYAAMATLAHRLEDRLDQWRRQDSGFTREQRSLCLQVCDRLEEMRSAVAAGGDGTLDWDDLEPLLGGPMVGPPCADGGADVASLSPGPGGLTVHIGIDPECGSPAARCYLILLRFKELCPGVVSVPPEAEILQGAGSDSLALSLPGMSREDVEAVYASLTEVSRLEFSEDAEGGSAPRPEPTPRDALDGAAVSPGEESRVKLPEAVQAPISLLDEFVDLLGEMTIARSHLEELAQNLGSEILKEEVDGLGKLVRAFHSRVMGLRMLPFSLITGSLKRLVREHAARLDKAVDLRLFGEEIGMDKSILLQVSDPLLHLLRNALDHGLEPAEDRRRRGKPERGAITITAARSRNRVEITVSDDGRGIDTEAVRRKAVERGIHRDEESRALSPSEVLACLFRPGFSTLDAVSELSGRGVGLDVVKTKLDNLGGAIEVTSTYGEGTEFRLSLPLSVAIIPVLLVEVGESVLALPTSIVAQTVEANPRDVRKHQEGDHVLLTEKGQVPIISLARVLKLGGRQKFERLPLVLIHHRGGRAALAVDRFVTEEDLFIKPLKGPLRAFRGISGYSVLGDGRLVFLIDPPTLFEV